MKALDIGRRLLPYFKEHRADIAKAALAALLVTASELSRPIILRYIIDSAVPAANVNAILQFSGLFTAILVLSVFIGYYQLVLMSRVGLRTINYIKSQVFSHLLSLDLSFFNRHKVGWLLSRVEGDAEQLKQLCSHITVRLFTDGLVFFGIVVTLFVADYEIAGPMVILLAVLLVIVFAFLGWIRTIHDTVRTKYAELTGFISEYVQGVQVIQLYNRQDDIRQELMEKSDELYEAQVKASFCGYGFWAFFSFFTETLLIAIIIYVGVGKFFAGTMSLGKLVMFIQFARQMTWPLHSLSENLNQVQRSFVAAERLFSLLDEKSRVEVIAADEGQAHDPEVIEFKDVSFRYGDDEWAVRDLNFTVRKGEKVAIVGPSGGGKSTTANLLCRFHDPTSGSIFADGKDLRSYSPQEWRRSIGLVLQDIYLFPGTVLDNLRTLDSSIPDDKVQEAANRLGADQFIKRFHDGYETELAERGVNLSVGERQLLSFTRALAHEPRLMILDEATSSIDRQTEAMLQKALDSLLEGRTAVIIAHRLSTVRHVDRILVFNQGRIEEEGSHDELLKVDGLYKRLFTLQTKSQSRQEVAS